MPGGDRTGPNGLGPMSGKRMGLCAGYTRPGFYSYGFGRGVGRGFGRRNWPRGRRFWLRQDFYNPPVEINQEDEKTYLENIAQNLEEELKIVKEKLKDLSKEPE